MAENDETEERKHYRYKVTLRIWHPDIDPHEITAALSIEPKRTWRAGMPRTTPTGLPLNGVYRETYWCSNLRESTEYLDRAMSDTLAELVDRLSQHKEYFALIRRGGGRVELFVYWFFYHNSGDTLEPALMAKLADLQIALSFDVYGWDGESQ